MSVMKLLLALTALMSFASVGQLSADEVKTTTILIKGMHCGGCAKKVAGKLKAIPGVADAAVDASTSLATVTPQVGKAPSSRALWEAVEKAGYTTVKLSGPAGEFTEKPKS